MFLVFMEVTMEAQEAFSCAAFKLNEYLPEVGFPVFNQLFLGTNNLLPPTGRSGHFIIEQNRPLTRGLYQ